MAKRVGLDWDSISQPDLDEQIRVALKLPEPKKRIKRESKTQGRSRDENLPIDPMLLIDIAADYNAGMSITSLTKKYNIGNRRITRELEDIGVTIRRPLVLPNHKTCTVCGGIFYRGKLASENWKNKQTCGGECRKQMISIRMRESHASRR